MKTNDSNNRPCSLGLAVHRSAADSCNLTTQTNESESPQWRQLKDALLLPPSEYRREYLPHAYISAVYNGLGAVLVTTDGNWQSRCDARLCLLCESPKPLEMPPSKNCPYPGESGHPAPLTIVPWATRVHSPIDNSIGSTVFVGLSVVTDRQTTLQL